MDKASKTRRLLFRLGTVLILIGICVVMMSKPVTGLQVQLHIAHPLDAVQLDFRPREVRTCIGVVDARIEHLQKTPVCRS